MALKATATHAATSALLLWKQWNLHGFVLCSLCLQLLLFLCAPFRKKSTFVVLVVCVWSAYQLVDTVIFRALALIHSAPKQQGDRAEFVDLYTFWAAFLVLHFGGPDTITALAVEDNNLWIRSYVNFVSLMLAVGNALLAVPRDKRLLRPSILTSTMLILYAGFLKSFGRILSLSGASFRRFQWSLVQSEPILGLDYAGVVQYHQLHKNAGIPIKEELEPWRQLAAPVPRNSNNNNNNNMETRADGEGGGAALALRDAQLVKQAYRFFNKFKGMYVDMVYCCHDRKDSRDLFLGLSSDDALRVLDTEMKFAFDTFYTKTPLLSGPLGRIFCWSPIFLEVAALILWSLEYKNKLKSIDVVITRSLLFGAIFIDILAILRLYSSDWKMAAAPFQNVGPPSRLLHYVRRRRWGKYLPKQKQRSLSILFHQLSESISQFTLGAIFREWSETISQLNFINYCIDERSKSGDLFYSLIGAKDMMDGWRYVSDVRLTNDLRNFIFQEIRDKSVMAQDLDIWEELSSSRGSWILRCNASNDLNPATFEPWIMDVDYDESLLIWHIATELCYQTEQEPDEEDEIGHRRYSKILSDYMFYLFNRQPKMMSEMAPMAEVIFNDTFEEARHLFHEEMTSSSFPNTLKCKAKNHKVHKKACQKIMDVMPDLPKYDYPPPSYIKEDENSSVLFDACQLANRLKSRPWKLIGQIWVELLCYAAAHSPGNEHAAQLSAGGQLITLVRLLMLHFGLGNQFRRAKCSTPNSMDRG